MATLRKKKTNQGYIYVVDFYYQGMRHVYSTKTTEAVVAKKILKSIEAKIALGTFRLEDYQENQPRLSEFLDKYMKFLVVSGKTSSTVSREKIVVKHFTRIIGDPIMGSIDPQGLDMWMATRLQDVLPVTYNIELRTMKAIFNKAAEWRYIEKNPFCKRKKLKVEEHRLYMEDGELERFFNALSKLREETKSSKYKVKLRLFAYFCYFMLNTGLRREEGLGLLPQDVSFDAGILHIRKTKDKEARDVPLTQKAQEILKALGENPFSGLTKSFVSHTFKTVHDKAGLQGFKLHSLRHTYATKLIEAGVDVLTVSKILGHSDIKTTMIYAKVRLGSMKSAAKLFENLRPPVTFWLLGPGKVDADD